MKFLVKNRDNETVDSFEDEGDADEFVAARSWRYFHVCPDIDDAVERLRVALTERIEWATEYAEGHEDFVDGYAHIPGEMSHEWEARFEEWLDDNYEGSADTKVLATEIAENFDTSDCEAERNGSDYGCYSGSGCYIWGFKIEEVEEQIDIASCDVCSDLNEAGVLDDCLDELENDFCISRSRKRENQGTADKPCYRDVGRKLVNPHNRDYPAFEIYTTCSGGWDFVVSEDRMKELVTEGIVRLCESADCTK